MHDQLLPSTPQHTAPRPYSVLMVLPSLAVAVVLGGVAAACAPGTAAPAAATQTAVPAPMAAAAAQSDSGLPLTEPIELRAVNGLLDVVLEATVRTLPVPTDSTPLQQTLRTYRLLWANGISYADSNKVGFPGPTFKVTQGDSVRILLINNLPPDLPSPCENYPAARQRGDTVPWDSMSNCFHGPNSTNIHFHGFHVSPQPPADAVLMQIAPGDSFQYAFRIPANQSAGTHWYHPHKHGSVAQQVTNGMSGAFIILARHGGLDSVVRVRGIREVLVAVQEIDQNLNLIDNSIPRVKLVNGRYFPVITMAPGEVIRMRIVNENIAATAGYSLFFNNNPGMTEPSLYDVARDGVQYAPVNYDTINPDTELWLAPGNRLDAFVRAPCTGGTHMVQALVQRPQRDEPRKERVGAPLATVQPVLGVHVAEPTPGAPCTLSPLPTIPPLPDFLGNLSGSSDTASIPVIVFSDSAPPFAGPNPRSQSNAARFWLGTAQNPFMRMSKNVYIPVSSRGVRQPMVLGQTQTWMVVNNGTTANHPFHIHINPFQVDSVAYGPGDPFAGYFAILNRAAKQNRSPIWLDVLPLPKPYVDSTGPTPVTRPGYALIRQRYDPFLNADSTVCVGCGPPTGQFVMHCHILGHEERGMMQILEIFPTLTSAVASDGRVRQAYGVGAHPAPAPGSGTAGTQPHRH